MKAFWLVVVALVQISIAGQPVYGGDMESLKSLLIGKAPKSAEIYRLPDALLTRAAVSPEYLRLHASYKVTICDYPEEILRSLLSEKFAEDDRLIPDVRWGTVLYAEDGREIVSIYVDKFGGVGYVNGRIVRFSSSLASQLRIVLRQLQ